MNDIYYTCYSVKSSDSDIEFVSDEEMIEYYKEENNEN